MPTKRKTRTGKTLAVAEKTATILDEQYSIAREAFRLRREGKSLWEIAEELEISENEAKRGLAYVQKAAAELLSQGNKAELLSLEVMRLDQLQQAYWAAALSGDVRAADVVLKVLDKRTKLLGLDESVTVDARSQTVIVAGGEGEYIKALEAIRDSVREESA
jgi:hypothetical protein